ncbi:MAG: ABC transporter permease [Clostridiales bacterium]|jgi:ABC-2 type transport system permease protein|nr:ABC transporter permease [Clostridiales bacterium]
MSAYLAFTKKELIESVRTYKLLVLLGVFLLLGMMSPLFAKFMPEILKSVDFGGMELTAPEPTAMDSWTQFFKNVGQIGLLALVIASAGIMANELSKGTLVNILTKGMKRHTVILSKLTVAALIWAASYMLCLAAAYGYTAYFWDMGELRHRFLAFFSPWLLGLFLIQLLILGGTLFKTFIGSLMLTGGVVVAMSLLNIIPKLQRYNPISLCGDNTALMTGVKDVSDFLPAAIICALLVVMLTAASVVAFDRKQM